MATTSISTAINNLFANLRSHASALTSIQGVMANLQAQVADLSAKPTSVQEEIDALPGRRIESFIAGEIAFDTTVNNGVRGTPIILPISQDGPFVMTHYPVVMWRPSAPTNTPNYLKWRPVSSFPLPTQQITTDWIDISYELQDGGNQRNFQNFPRAPLLSRPDALLECAVPTLWSPNSTIVFTPTYWQLTFSSSPAPTNGILHCSIPGYRIVNL